MSKIRRTKLILGVVLLLSISAFSASLQFAQKKSRSADAPAKKQSATPENNTQEISADDVIRVKTNLVTVPVTVLTRQGKYLPGLRQADFHVYEDNVEQEISFFSDSESPLNIVLLIDTSNSLNWAYEVIGEAVNAFSDQLRPNDTVFPIAFDTLIRAPLPNGTSDKVLLRNTIRELSKPSAGSMEGTRIFDTVEFINKHLLPNGAGRKVVLIYSDGIDTNSRIGTRKGTLYDVTEVGAPYYTFGFHNSARSGRNFMSVDEWWSKVAIPRLDGQKYLRDLSERSGGRFTLDDRHFPDLIKKAYAALGNELVHQYFISYYPKSSTSSNLRRQIKVRVDRPGAKVRARSSYIFELLER